MTNPPPPPPQQSPQSQRPRVVEVLLAHIQKIERRLDGLHDRMIEMSVDAARHREASQAMAGQELREMRDILDRLDAIDRRIDEIEAQTIISRRFGGVVQSAVRLIAMAVAEELQHDAPKPDAPAVAPLASPELDLSDMVSLSEMFDQR